VGLEVEKEVEGVRNRYVPHKLMGLLDNSQWGEVVIYLISI
jgi:hypothetical protein